MGRRFSCPACGHSFIWSDCFHAGDSFVIYDLETTGPYPDSDEFIQIAAVRLRAGCLCPAETFFSFARGDVDLLGRAVEEMSRRLSLDTSFNGVPRHATLLPHV
jgi:DNA polymerase III epsilon subunit-like protein